MVSDTFRRFKKRALLTNMDNPARRYVTRCLGPWACRRAAGAGADAGANAGAVSPPGRA